jgi:GTP pyrophosphokinase
LADVLSVLTQQKVSPLKVEAGVRADDTAHIELRLAVSGNTELETIRGALAGVEGVSAVVRLGRGKRTGG